MSGLEEKGMKALELARRELDFARLADDAPNTKQMLLKAQTFVPLAPPKPWGKRVAQTVAALAVVAVLFVPWIPKQSRISTLNVQFDAPVLRQEAQTLAFDVLRELPPEIMLAAEFGSNAIVLEEDQPGQLSLRLSGLTHPSQLEDAARDILESDGTANASTYITPGMTIRDKRWRSPANMMAGLFTKPAQTVDELNPGLLLELNLVEREPLLRSGLTGYLAGRGFELADFALLSVDKVNTPARFDFMLSGCWPRNIGVTVAGWHELTTIEQQQLQEETEHFFRTFNIYQSGVLLAEAPNSWQPLIVQVVDSTGRSNDYLSQRLQAHLMQPDPALLNGVTYQLEETIDAAMQAYLPQVEYQIQKSPTLDAGRRTSGYYVTVTITGKRGNSITDRTMRELENKVEF